MTEPAADQGRAGDDVTEYDVIGPLHVPKALYSFAGLSTEERHAMDVWCATQQREYENRLRRAMERLATWRMP